MRNWKKLVLPATIAVGALFLFVSSQSGIWDPWEMDRAHVARQIAGKPKILVVEDGSAVQQKLEEVGDGRFHLLEMGFSSTEVPDKLKRAEASRALKIGEERLAREVAHAVFIQAGLMVGDDGERQGRVDLARQLESLQSYQESAPGAMVLLVGESTEQCQRVRGLLERAMVRQALAVLDEEAGLAPGGGKPDVEVDENLVSQRAGAYPFVLDFDCVSLDDSALTEALAAVEGMTWTRIQYKALAEPSTAKKRTPATLTASVPPLDYWMTAASYRVFGFSEFSTRLPGLLMGLLTLLLFGWMVARLLGKDSTTSLLAPVILLTLPMFLGQAKILSGEISYTLFLTLGVLLFAGMQKHGAGVLRMLLFVAALAGLFLAKGLFGLMVLTAVVWGYVAVSGEWRRRSAWVPAGVLLVVFLGLVAVVQWPAEWTFFDHFKFMNRGFEGGPLFEHRTFEYFVRSIAFAWLPWVFILPFAVARLLPWSSRPRGDVNFKLLTFVWFTVPFVLHMALLPDFLQALLPTTTAAALALAFLWGETEPEGNNLFQGVVVVGVGAVLLNNLLTSPEHLLSFLTWDPPFSHESTKFPVDFQLGGLGLAVLAALMLTFFWYYASGGTLFKKVARFFQKGAAFWLLFLLFSTVLVARIVVGLMLRFSEGVSKPALIAADEATRLMPATSEAAANLSLFLLIPLVILGLSALLALPAVWNWMASGLDRFWSWFGAFGRFKKRAIAGFGAFMEWLASRHVFALMALGLSVAAAVDMVISLQALIPRQAQLPELASQVFPAAGYASRLMGNAGVVVALGLGVVVALCAWLLPSRWSWMADRMGRTGWREIGLLALTLAVQVVAVVLFSYTDMRAFDIPVLLGLSAFFWVAGVLSLRGVGLARFAASILLVLVMALGAVFVPLASDYGQLQQVVWPNRSDSYLVYVLVGSRLSLALYGLLFLVMLNGLMGSLGRVVEQQPALLQWRRRVGVWNPTLWPELLEQKTAMRMVVLVLALAFSGFYAVKFLPSFAREVSQKHILDLYFQAEGRSDVGPELYKYARGGGNREDRNFYTASIPAIDNQNDLDAVLLPVEDRVLRVGRSASDKGAPTVVLRGFDPVNDANGDGQRDYRADAGIATRVDGPRVFDETRSWTPGEWKGAVFVDWRGSVVRVEDNDEVSVTLQFAPPLDPSRPERMAYVLDAPEAVNHKASAMESRRNYVIMDQENFSSVNFSFRAKSKGRHIPVLEGSNANFLLAASELREGESNENRFAQYTLSPEQFRQEQGVKGSWINFDNKVKFLGYKLNSETLGRNEKVTVRFYFECTGKISGNWKVFVHMDSIESSNRINGDHWPLNMSEDPEEKECVGCWRTNHWMEGDIIADEFTREVPLGSPTGRYNIHFGLYQPGADNRMPVVDWDRSRVKYDASDKDRVTVGSFEVH